MIMMILVTERQLHSMAKVYNILETWQGMQNLYATVKKSQTENKQTPAIG
jgi:hypothetical protein